MTEQSNSDPATKGWKLLRIEQVLEVFPVSRSSWYAGVKVGEYPRAVRIGARSVAWWEHEVLAVARKRASAR